jgi:LemA protein
MKKTILVVGGLILVGVLSLISFYNNLVSKTQAIENQWAQVETQYQRRFDLIPNLVESVRGFFTQEQRVFSEIAQARTKYAGAGTVDEKAKAAGELETVLGRLLVIIENYPELRSSERVADLMDELAGTENRIAIERRRYNEEVRDYNVAIKRFPGNLIAGVFGFSERAYFEAAPGAEEAPRVELVPREPEEASPSGE